MSPYVLGMLVGRLVFSYLLVWFFIFLIRKFEFRASIKTLHSLPGLGAVLLIFLLPLLGQIGGRLSP